MRGADPLPLRSASPTGIAATEAALRRSLEAKEGTERFYLTELRRAAVCYNGVLQTFEQAERLEGRAAHDSSERRSLSASRESTRRLYPFTDTGRPRLPLTNCGTRCSPSHRRSTGTGTAESAGCFNALHLPLRGSATSSLRSLSPMAPPLASSVSAVTPSCASSDASMLYFDDLVSRAKMLRRARREPPPQPPAECSAAPSRRPVEAAPTAAGRTNSCLLRAQQPQEQDSLPLSPASAGTKADREPTELSGSSAAAGRAEEAVAWPRDGNANEELYNGEHPATPRVVGGAERRDRAGETDPSRGVSKPAAPEQQRQRQGSRLEEAGVTEMTRESPVRGDASVQSWRLRAGRWHCEPAVAPGKVAEVAEAPSPAEWPFTAPSFRSGAAAPRHAALASPTPDSSDRSASASVSCASAAAAVMDAGRKSPAAGGRPAARPWHQQADREPTELSGSSAAAGRAEEAVAWPRDGNANEELYNGEHPATPRVVGGAERRDRAGETDPSRGVSKPAAPESSSASSGSRLEEAGVTEMTRESPVRGDASVQSWRLRAGRWHCEPAVAPGKVAEVAEAPSPAEWPSTAPSFRSGAAAPRHAALASPTPDSSDRSASASVSCASAAAAVMDAGRKSPAAGGRPAARPWHQQADREPTELSGSSAAAGRAEEAVAWPRDGNANEELYNGEHPATPRVVGGAERRDRAGETDPSRGVSKPAAPESSSASSGSRLEEAGVTEMTRESPVRGDASVQSWRLRAGRWHCEPAVAPGKVAEVAEAPSPAEWPSTAPSFRSGAAAPRHAALASPTPDSSSRGTSEEGSWKKGMASVLAGEAVSLRPLPVEKDVLFGWQALLAKVKGEYPVDAGAAEPRTSSYRKSEWMELNRSRSPGPRNSGEAEPAVEVRDGDTSGVTEIHYHYHISLGAESHPAPALSIASSALRRLERFETAQRAAVVTAWIIGFTALAQASAAVAPMHRRPPEQLRERRGSSDGSVADAAQASHHRSGPEPLTEPDGAPMQETRAPAPARGDSTAPAPASLAPLAVLTSDTLFATVDRALRVHPRVGCPYPFRPGDLLVAIEGRTVLFLEEVATWEAHLDWARYDEQYVTVTRSRPARPGRRSASRAATVRSLDGRRCAVHIKIQPPGALPPPHVPVPVLSFTAQRLAANNWCAAAVYMTASVLDPHQQLPARALPLDKQSLAQDTTLLLSGCCCRTFNTSMVYAAGLSIFQLIDLSLSSSLAASRKIRKHTRNPPPPKIQKNNKNIYLPMRTRGPRSFALQASLTLSEAVNRGRRLGLLSNEGNAYSCCRTTGDNPFAKEVPSAPPSATSGWEPLDVVQRKQAFLTRASRIPSQPRVAMLGAHANTAHVEGVVREVRVGCPRPETEEEWESPARRHTVPSASPPTTQLWLWVDVADSEAGVVPLAVVCPLSAQQAAVLSPAADSADLPRYFQQLLLNKRVIVSGQLRLEERYDGDLHRIVQVPRLQLSEDGFRRDIRDVAPLLSHQEKSPSLSASSRIEPPASSSLRDSQYNNNNNEQSPLTWADPTSGPWCIGTPH
eukprot:gene4960-3558_t